MNLRFLVVKISKIKKKDAETRKIFYFENKINIMFGEYKKLNKEEK